MKATNQAPIIIKKVKKGVGHGHHGGAWKVAYADFVTAMMAFFLLMWLINTTSPEQRRGIAEFFAPASVSETTSGAGGMLAGEALAEKGAKQVDSEPTSERSELGDVDGQGDGPQSQTAVSESALNQARAMRENAEFDRAELAIRQAMEDMPDVADLSRHILMEQTPEGLRLQIIDQEGRSMFNPADAQPNERARRLLAAVAEGISGLSNRITISGHTDASSSGRFTSNWELSAARANAARAIIARNGVTPDRIYQIAGRADSEPLYPDDPTQPGNRRIAITLLREAPVLPPGAAP